MFMKGLLCLLLIIVVLCEGPNEKRNTCASRLNQTSGETDEILFICKQLYEFREKNEDAGPCTSLFSLKNNFEDKILIEDETCYAKVKLRSNAYAF